jgi:hypothetical protein
VQEWGWTVPVLIDEAGGLIAGHGRVLAAQLLGLDTVPVMVAAGWSDTQKRAYIIADNKLALNAGWDPELLRGELTDLQTGGADLALMGFSPDEVAAILVDKTVGLTDPDDAPEPPANPVSVLGDVWLLGRHRLCCGDSTTVEAVDAVLGGVRPHLMVTDPPYGVEYDAGWRATVNNDGSNSKRAVDNRNSETGHSTQKPVECMKRPMENNSKPGDAVYDPFVGSGTTIIAGEITGRAVIALELSPVYVDVAILRWQAFTGQTATLEGDGRSYAEVAAARLKTAA